MSDSESPFTVGHVRFSISIYRGACPILNLHLQRGMSDSQRGSVKLIDGVTLVLVSTNSLFSIGVSPSKWRLLNYNNGEHFENERLRGENGESEISLFYGWLMVTRNYNDSSYYR